MGAKLFTCFAHAWTHNLLYINTENLEKNVWQNTKRTFIPLNSQIRWHPHIYSVLTNLKNLTKNGKLQKIIFNTEVQKWQKLQKCEKSANRVNFAAKILTRINFITFSVLKNFLKCGQKNIFEIMKKCIYNWNVNTFCGHFFVILSKIYSVRDPSLIEIFAQNAF